MFDMFKKSKVENEESADMKDIVITLPKSGKEMSFEDVIKNADQHLVNEYEDKDKKNKKKNEEKKDRDEEGMENEDDDKKAMNDETIAKIVRMVHKEVMNTMEEEKAKNKKKNDDDDKKSENEDDDKKSENEDDDKDKMKNSISPNFIKALQNAGYDIKEKEETLKNEIDLTSDKLARGKARY